MRNGQKYEKEGKQQIGLKLNLRGIKVYSNQTEFKMKYLNIYEVV